MILKVPQTRSPSAALVTCQFKCGRLFGVGLRAQMKAFLVREELYFNQKCQFNQANALLYMFYFLVYPV